MALARLLLAVLLTCADCLQTEEGWRAAPAPAPDAEKDDVCTVKAGHFSGFHTSDSSEGMLKKIKNTADKLFASLDYIWGLFTERRYLVGLIVKPWGAPNAPTSCDAAEIFKWSLVKQGATNADGPAPKPYDNDAAAEALKGMGLQYTKDTAWKTYAYLYGAWAASTGVLIAKAVNFEATEFSPEAFKDLLGAEIKVMNAGCKGDELFCPAKALLRRKLFAEIEKKYFPAIKQAPGPETKGTGR